MSRVEEGVKVWNVWGRRENAYFRLEVCVRKMGSVWGITSLESMQVVGVCWGEWSLWVKEEELYTIVCVCACVCTQVLEVSGFYSIKEWCVLWDVGLESTGTWNRECEELQSTIVCEVWLKKAGAPKLWLKQWVLMGWKIVYMGVAVGF